MHDGAATEKQGESMNTTQIQRYDVVHTDICFLIESVCMCVCARARVCACVRARVCVCVCFRVCVLL